MATPTFSQALDEATHLALESFPERSQRIAEAAQLVRDGRVFQRDDHEWEVDSVSHAGLRHSVNGHCDCPDYTYRNDEGPCKHQIAVMISQRTLSMLQSPTAPQNTAMPPTPPALPEARCSVNVHITVQGRDCLVTLRDHDEASLLQRLEKLLSQVPAPSEQKSQPRPQPQAAPPADTPPQCPQHGAMKASTKGTGWYCPHRLDDGSWCQHKGR
jgi:hypothetical protein